ncbi:MAG: hypothetical protein HDT28_02115 [Clostridiales bacterium]|nr:hypothetical protein [Clostridiales bacterium]
MYGYIVPDKNTLRASDFVLYRSFYCGMCCETGRAYGQLPRFTTNYDFAFLSALMHDYAQADVVIEERPCVLNPHKKAILQHNALLSKLAATNIMLCYQKADDGVKDGDGAKYRILRKALKRPFRKAKAACPEVWERIKAFDAEQQKVEKTGVQSLDRAADPFASLMRDLPVVILGAQTDDNLKGLCYNIGKFVYLVDALDDIQDDFKKKRYNPFLAAFGGFDGRAKFIEQHKAELEFCLFTVCSRAESCFRGLRLTQSYTLLDNVVTKGMRGKTNELLGSTKKLKNPRI